MLEQHFAFRRSPIKLSRDAIATLIGDSTPDMAPLPEFIFEFNEFRRVRKVLHVPEEEPEPEPVLHIFPIVVSSVVLIAIICAEAVFAVVCADSKDVKLLLKSK